MPSALTKSNGERDKARKEFPVAAWSGDAISGSLHSAQLHFLREPDPRGAAVNVTAPCGFSKKNSDNEGGGFFYLLSL